MHNTPNTYLHERGMVFLYTRYVPTFVFHAGLKTPTDVNKYIPNSVVIDKDIPRYLYVKVRDWFYDQYNDNLTIPVEAIQFLWSVQKTRHSHEHQLSS